LKSAAAEDHERNYFAVGELASFSENPAEWENVSADLRRYFAENKLEQDLDALNLRTSARTYDDGRTKYLIIIIIFYFFFNYFFQFIIIIIIALY